MEMHQVWFYGGENFPELRCSAAVPFIIEGVKAGLFRNAETIYFSAFPRTGFRAVARGCYNTLDFMLLQMPDKGCHVNFSATNR